MKQIIAQTIGIIACTVAVLSFQCKKNKHLFLMQALSGLLFSVNYFLIGAIPGMLFNLASLVRGTLLSKNGKKLWKVIFINVLMTVCFAYSVSLLAGDWLQIALSFLTFSGMFIMTVFMYKGNAKHIRYFQVAYASPSWLVYNVVNFTLGGIICEVFNMASVGVYFLRCRNDAKMQVQAADVDVQKN